MAGQAGTTVVSPDKKTFLVLTSAYNLMNATSGGNVEDQVDPNSNEYVFVDSIANKLPIQTQVLQFQTLATALSPTPAVPLFLFFADVRFMRLT